MRLGRWSFVSYAVMVALLIQFAGEASIFSTSQGTQRKVDEFVRGCSPNYADDLYGKDWKGRMEWFASKYIRWLD